MSSTHHFSTFFGPRTDFSIHTESSGTKINLIGITLTSLVDSSLTAATPPWHETTGPKTKWISSMYIRVGGEGLTNIFVGFFSAVGHWYGYTHLITFPDGVKPQGAIYSSRETAPRDTNPHHHGNKRSQMISFFAVVRKSKANAPVARTWNNIKNWTAV